MSLPEILALLIDESRAVFDLFVPGDSDVFRGHFPGTPILPGVVQIDWAVQLAALHLTGGEPVAKDFQVKFRRKIAPESKLVLILNLDPSKGRLTFEYRTGDEIMSSGWFALRPAS